MNYIEAREYMRTIQKSGIKLGLSRMRELMRIMGDPQNKIRIIHVAGTNGKGSTINFISAILNANGYKTGMYTSPSVEDVREQYILSGKWISEEDYATYVTKIYEYVEAMNDIHKDEIDYEAPTAFETETAMAFLYFYEKKCDFLILETGMGGREDATNVIDKTLIEVFTSIAEDHIGMIGNNIEEIAKTKAGIIKRNSCAVLQDNKEEAIRVIRQECDELNAKLYEIKKSDVIIHNDCATETVFDYDEYKNIRLSMKGSYQIDNATLALKVIDVLKSVVSTLKIDNEKTKQALYNAHWPFRMERIATRPLFYVDGAHNPDAAIRLKETLENDFEEYRKIFIMGMFKDKDYGRVVELMCPLSNDILVVDTKNSVRALPKEELKECIVMKMDMIHHKLDVIEAMEVKEAVERSIELATAYDKNGHRIMILAFGSLSYLSEIKGYVTDKIL